MIEQTARATQQVNRPRSQHRFPPHGILAQRGAYMLDSCTVRRVQSGARTIGGSAASWQAVNISGTISTLIQKKMISLNRGNRDPELDSIHMRLGIGVCYEEIDQALARCEFFFSFWISRLASVDEIKGSKISFCRTFLPCSSLFYLWCVVLFLSSNFAPAKEPDKSKRSKLFEIINGNFASTCSVAQYFRRGCYFESRLHCWSIDVFKGSATIILFE